MRLLASTLLAAGLLACHTDQSRSLGTAEGFIDQYYVQIDLAGARHFCTGLALRKVQEQLRLVEGQRIDESTQKPLVRYRLLETRSDDAEHVSYLFQGSVYIAGASTLTPRWLVATRRESDGWRVSNFTEIP